LRFEEENSSGVEGGTLTKLEFEFVAMWIIRLRTVFAARRGGGRR
jgi:hypothetical protein